MFGKETERHFANNNDNAEVDKTNTDVQNRVITMMVLHVPLQSIHYRYIRIKGSFCEK